VLLLGFLGAGATRLRSAAGTATLLSGAMFPLLALSTLGFELWLTALAVTWLRERA
jgi:hypothetical protein